MLRAVTFTFALCLWLAYGADGADGAPPSIEAQGDTVVLTAAAVKWQPPSGEMVPLATTDDVAALEMGLKEVNAHPRPQPPPPPRRLSRLALLGRSRVAAAYAAGCRSSRGAAA